VPSLTIDGRQVNSPDGTTVIQAAESLGIFVPRYCYHPALSVAGNCRICLVEVEKAAKLQIACNTPVSEGMVVHTASAKAEDGRRAVLEFLLANHPLDCPVCDQSGECELQNFYMNFGRYDARFREQKVKKKKAVAVGPHVMLDQERCILCSRCVRFTDEITKTGEFGIFNRGDRAELGLYPGQSLTNPYSGNVIDVCPVGALTEQDFRFKARVWYLASAPSICNGCAQGCNVDVHYVLDRPHLDAGARIMRLKPRYNPDVNQWWMCDEGRFGFHSIDRGRLTHVRHRGAERSWEQAIDAITAALAPSGARLGVIASTGLSNEELFLVRDVLQRGLGARVTTAVPAPPGYSDGFLIKADKSPNTAGAAALGLVGPDVPSLDDILADARAGRIDALWVFGLDLAAVIGDDQLEALSRTLGLLIYSGTNDNRTAATADWVLPAAAYLEKDGTFVNCHGRVQRIGCAFPPLAGSREDWAVLLDVARRLESTRAGVPPSTGHEGPAPPLSARAPKDIFAAMAATTSAFEGLSYEVIGSRGASIRQ